MGGRVDHRVGLDQNGAYEHPNQSTPINFSAFLTSLTDIARAAEINSPSTNFDDGTRDVWKLVFLNTGKFTAQACDLNSGDAAAETLPTTNCTTRRSTTCRPNGAIYSPRT